MARSYIAVGERTAEFNDSDLLVVAALMRSFFLRGGPGEAATLADAWEEAIRLRGPGVFELPLERFAREPASLGLLLASLDCVDDLIQGSGVELQPNSLPEDCDLPGVRFRKPYPTRHLIKAVTALRGLLQEPESPGPGSAGR